MPLPASPPADVTLRVTRAFGAEPIVQSAQRPGGSVVDVLRASIPIEATRAGFVTAIGDLRSGTLEGRDEDWFYFINGVLSPVGAAQYRPASGDHIWWDYHPWSEGFQVGALVGAFPEPFAHGHGGKTAPTRLLHAAGFEAEASAIAARLKELGVRDVVQVPFGPSVTIDVETSFPLLLGPWGALVAHPAVADIHRHAAKTGLLVEFSDRGASGRDWHGEAPGPPAPGGAILAAKTGARRGACLWLVTGTGDVETRATAGLLARSPESLAGAAGLMIVDGRRVTLPLPIRPRAIPP
ncbi:MAG: DUF4430 domain-containing protein [Verrucomicrobiae bacterium]|nr:DUF4430 domain-containing protein [Verrucomicrobiae bacterium]